MSDKLDCSCTRWCDNCMDCFYTENIECRTRRGGRVKSSCATCTCSCFCCACLILSLIAYFTFEAWEKYNDAEQDYCQYIEGLSYADYCTTSRNQDGTREYYAYNTTYCGLIYKNSGCDSSQKSIPATVDAQKSGDCYIFSCDSWNDVSWVSPDGYGSTFYLCSSIAVLLFLFMMFIGMGYCYWKYTIYIDKTKPTGPQVTNSPPPFGQNENNFGTSL